MAQSMKILNPSEVKPSRRNVYLAKYLTPGCAKPENKLISALLITRGGRREVRTMEERIYFFEWPN